MQNKIISFATSIALASLFLMTASCQNDDSPEVEAAKPLNAFDMRVNGQIWQPTQIGEDACMRTIKASFSARTEGNGERKPYYTVSAYNGVTAADINKSENALTLQFMDVVRTGTYTITGTHTEPHHSYAVFFVNKPGEATRIYVNKTDKANFKVTVDEFYPVSGSIQTGIRGSFSGTLYNENNPLDSVTLEQGNFTLKKLGWNTFNQCEQ